MAQKVAEAQLNLTDVTTGNVSSTAHGFAPKSPADATQFLNGATTPAFAQVKGSDLSMSDVTTNNVSITKHGFVPKAPNVATQYLDGTGAWSTPAGGGSSSPELAYAERTTNLSVTATSEGTAQQIVVTGSITLDGSTPILITFFCATVTSGAGLIEIDLYEDSTTLGIAGEGNATRYVSRRRTPSAGSHTYSAYAWLSTGTSGTVIGGAGGSGAYVPAFILVTKC